MCLTQNTHIFPTEPDKPKEKTPDKKEPEKVVEEKVEELKAEPQKPEEKPEERPKEPSPEAPTPEEEKPKEKSPEKVPEKPKKKGAPEFTEVYEEVVSNGCAGYHPLQYIRDFRVLGRTRTMVTFAHVTQGSARVREGWVIYAVSATMESCW